MGNSHAVSDLGCRESSFIASTAEAYLEEGSLPGQDIMRTTSSLDAQLNHRPKHAYEVETGGPSADPRVYS